MPSFGFCIFIKIKIIYTKLYPGDHEIKKIGSFKPEVLKS